MAVLKKEIGMLAVVATVFLAAGEMVVRISRIPTGTVTTALSNDNLNPPRQTRSLFELLYKH